MNFIEYSSEEGILRFAPQLWQELHYYEVMDALKSADQLLCRSVQKLSWAYHRFKSQRRGRIAA